MITSFACFAFVIKCTGSMRQSHTCMLHADPIVGTPGTLAQNVRDLVVAREASPARIQPSQSSLPLGSLAARESKGACCFRGI